VCRTKTEHVDCRLVMRRVKRFNTNARQGQDTLFDAYRYHAFITNSDLTAIDADRFHRGHAIIEQVIADLKDGPLAHLPSGRFAANAAWVQFAIIAHNLSRAASTAAGLGKARKGTLLRTIIHTPARLATIGGDWSCTCPQPGPRQTPGHGSGKPRPDHQALSRPDQPAPTGATREPKWKSQRGLAASTHPNEGHRHRKRQHTLRTRTVDQG
jgi:hypothetical protein